MRFKGRRPPGGSPARAFVRSAAPAQPGPHPAPHSPHLRPAQHAPRTPTWPARLAAPALPGSHPAPAPAPLLASRLAPRIPHPASSTCACSPGGLTGLQPERAACRSSLVPTQRPRPPAVLASWLGQVLLSPSAPTRVQKVEVSLPTLSLTSSVTWSPGSLTCDRSWWPAADRVAPPRTHPAPNAPVSQTRQQNGM